jgi:hypothetical protein
MQHERKGKQQKPLFLHIQLYAVPLLSIFLVLLFLVSTFLLPRVASVRNTRTTIYAPMRIETDLCYGR